MKVVKLGELVSVQTGKLDANASSLDGEYPFFTCAREPLRISDWKYDLDAILVAGNGDLNVKHYNGRFDAYQRTYILSSKDQGLVDTRYLYHFMDTYLETLRAQSIGGIIKYIKLGMLTDAPIPLPPLAEQKRIAAILDQADGLRRKRQHSLDRLSALGQAIFHEMFGDPTSNEMRWPKIGIKDTGIKIADGNYSSKYPTKDDFVEQGVPFIRANNMKAGEISDEDMRYISPQKHAELKKGHLCEGDILLTTRGQIGNVSLVPRRHQNSNINAQIVLLRPDKKSITSEYLFGLFSTQSMKSALEGLQTGVALQQLPVGKLKEVEIIVPPMYSQQQYADKARSLTEMRIQSYTAMVSAEQLFQSLQHRAFRGEL
ncbi:restriction endonuclease subunit S [Novosphingobium umbonatum]|uniref:Restriction endonuclease subunit S n=1 Tax=Novosphingobium umbonatum TaxID=1908524 RepID=A0A3S2Y4P1_9SPHN|nr:restriction endonuclease subunit S [Novosphingobium umbonatum]RVU03406.1 restriction endonuclease subunit S [Novosphingobium umbonatum]